MPSGSGRPLSLARDKLRPARCCRTSSTAEVEPAVDVAPVGCAPAPVVGAVLDVDPTCAVLSRREGLWGGDVEIAPFAPATSRRIPSRTMKTPLLRAFSESGRIMYPFGSCRDARRACGQARRRRRDQAA